MDSDYLTITELAALLKIRKSWIYARTRERGPNAIPQIRIGKFIRFEKSSVLDWIMKQQNRI